MNRPTSTPLIIPTKETGALRDSITPFQRELLDAAFTSWLEKDTWILARELHVKFEKSKVLEAFRNLGGSIVFEMEDNSASSRYQLSALGILASSVGVHAEELLVRYLTFVRRRFHQDPGATQLRSEDIRAALELPQQDSKLLGKLIQVTMWCSNGSGFSADGSWYAGLPRDVDDIPEDPRPYIQSHLFAIYEPGAPVFLAERYHQMSNRVEAMSELWFVADAALRTQLELDWNEAKATRNAKAWKCCVIMCGGILEGLLLDRLKGDPAKAVSARAAISKKANPDIETWTLAEMIDVASHLKILQKGAGHVGHALREYRNLVHPAKQVKEKITVTEAEASLSFSGVQVCIADFARQAVAQSKVSGGTPTP